MQFLASVIVLGAFYALLAAGFVVIYRSSRILNFAYADMAMVAGYLAVSVTAVMGGPPVVALLVVLLVSAVFGLVVYFFLIQPMAGQPTFSAIILTVALGIILNAFAILVWRGEMEVVRIGWRAYLSVAGMRLSSVEVVIVATAVVFFLGLGSFYRFSTIGRQMRAVAEKPLLAAQKGINIHLVTAVAWGIGIFAAGVAGILLGANYGVSLAIGHVAVKAFAVALVGGLDSIKGVVPAALLVALAELTANSYINPRFADALPYIIMMIVLLIRPWGFFGTEEEIERV